ncbi:uncharacterized protein LOC130672865 [Microplitis mediator]|uniref:uncharacterized protein LOC130672865 n=1 Tax=Microplitis mediator TaxID=375433 RepID=UPI0025524DDF|nr:uncharacterized protein LOC130672865 [Microplitis mediator]
MVHSSCCVVDCKNTGRNSNCKFYRFPTASWKLEKRKQWINAVKRKNPDGSPWTPRPTDCICSDHFVGGKKAEEAASPSYIPTIFPSVYKKSKINEKTALSRHARFLNRRLAEKEKTPTTSSNASATAENKKIIIDNEVLDVTAVSEKVDKSCQIDFFSTAIEIDKTFVCNRYIYSHTDKCDAEIQTNIPEATRRKFIFSKPKCSDKQCGTPTKTFVDQSTETSVKSFVGFDSIEKNEQLMELAGVTLNNFELLLKLLSTSTKFTVAKNNRLFIFLMKIKTGLTFSALSVLFSVHRTTISRIFYSTLQTLSAATATLVYWPKMSDIQATMPKCFHPNYSNIRVIIDCTEFNVEIPSTVDSRDYCLHGKKTFTAKVLIGITPGGFVCLKSKVAGGRKTDSQLTIESGLMDELDEGDNILIYREFPEIKAAVDKSGKKVTIVMPPDFEKKTVSSGQESKDNDVAKVRIHIEKIMQRLRCYSIFNKITENLFNCVDDIVHICCVLVNLQQMANNIKPLKSNEEKMDE